jgi:phage terminase large subunit-like protein
MKKTNGQKSKQAHPLFEYSNPFVEKAMQYGREVVAGAIPACIYVRQACQRHLDDLQRSLDPVYPYRFDELKAARVCWFISKMPHVKGKWAVRVRGAMPRIVLEPWQCFVLCVIFGWVRKSSGLRRFTRVYEEVPRKNGKSIQAAGIGLYMFAADGESGAEVFSGATKEKQAMEVFRPARRMAMLSPMFLKKFDIEVNKKSLTRYDDSRFEPLVKNPGDGSSPSCAIVDEYHEHDTSTLYDAMQTGMGSRQQPLLFVITTAGFNVGGPCYLLRADAVKVLSGAVQDDQFFAIIYTLDEGDDWKSEESLRKCNPNFGVSVFEDYLLEQQQLAINFAHKQNTILTKHFGIWTNAASAWMNMEKWNGCADPTLKIDDFKGQQCWAGNDLAAKVDLASRALLFKRREDDGRDHYYYFGYHYAPKQTIQDGAHQHYEQWMHSKYLIAVEGAEIRLSQIERDIDAAAEIYDMQAIAFDEWSALQMQQELAAKYGDDIVVTVPQRAQYLSDPMKELQAAVYAGRFHHNGDPVMTWAMSNVEVREGQNESWFPRKGPDEKLKIDPVAALITAMNRAYTAPPAMPSVYETRGFECF